MIIILLDYHKISENMSRVEHILVCLQQASCEHEELSHVKEKYKNYFKNPLYMNRKEKIYKILKLILMKD